MNMYTFENVIKTEELREFNIYIYKEGLFYKIYNQSAKLFDTYIHQGYKVNTKFIKNINDYILSIGIPKNIFKKLQENTNIDIHYDDKINVYCVNLKNISNADIQSTLDNYPEWKDNIVKNNIIIDNSKNKKTNEDNKDISIPIETYNSIKDIIKSINEYPLGTKEIYELPMFIGTLQKLCRNIKL